jgi:hypothetical protein
MPRQISDEEWARLQSRDQIASFVESIYNDPTLSREAKALIKKKYPQIAIPDYDLMNQVEQRFAEERQQREEEKRTQREQEEQREYEQTRAATQKKYGFTEEAMTDLEKFMVERNIGDYEVAATYRATQNPKTSEALIDDQRWNHSKKEGFAEIAKDPEGWAKMEIMKSMSNDAERAKQQKF